MGYDCNQSTAKVLVLTAWLWQLVEALDQYPLPYELQRLTDEGRHVLAVVREGDKKKPADATAPAGKGAGANRSSQESRPGSR